MSTSTSGCPESNVNSTVSGDKHVVPDNLEEVFKDEIQDAGNNSTVDLNVNAEEQKDWASSVPSPIMPRTKAAATPWYPTSSTSPSR